MFILGTSTDQKKLAAVSGWRNQKVSFGSDENVLDNEGCPALKVVRILRMMWKGFAFTLHENSKNTKLCTSKEQILYL